ncbi:hypothetical protein ALP8811_00393 [Aliiroseovarius pelagivivens]|uniref:SGNH hydrolase-type esterase domain-containing protein n=1 Tax=Aliiroseovarius pelagivivens TaxID=1639690 RepID=A0A2R8AH95_9RHOB|nr:GDSL-type esterase/lipase family protein [Aliiroseovarius pelagivivens]SPF75406.1 hypothetical protein ALP8811_00393 [Aliiroseovarius pelagivivens]
MITRIGSVLCIMVAGYFLATAGYALMNASSYAVGTARVMRYVIAPGAIGLIFLLVALFVKSDRRLLIGIYAFSTLVALFAFEAFLTWRSIQGSIGLAGFIQGEDTSYERYQQTLPPTYTLKALNRDLGVPSLAEMQMGAIPGKEVLLCTRDGQPVSYVADRYGLRNPDDVHDAPVELLLLGDSFTEGICLPEGEDIASQIRAEEPAMVNTGTRGAGPLYELAVLRRWGMKLRPEHTVIFFFEGNDWQNIKKELTFPFLTDALDPSKPVGPVASAVNSPDAINQILDGWWGEQSQSLEGFLGRRSWRRNFFALQQSALVMGIHYPKATVEKPEYLQILHAARSTVDQWEGKLTLVYIPQVDRFVGLLPSASVYDELRNRVRNAADQAGLDFVDLVPLIEAQKSPRSAYAADSHFNALGARLAAEAVLAHLGK